MTDPWVIGGSLGAVLALVLLLTRRVTLGGAQAVQQAVPRRCSRRAGFFEVGRAQVQREKGSSRRVGF